MKVIITILVVSMLFVTSGCLMSEDNMEGVDNYITAMEAISILNREFNKTYILTGLGLQVSKLYHGKTYRVDLSLYCKVNDSLFIDYGIDVYYYGIEIWGSYNFTKKEERGRVPITNWTIDSDEAYEIAANNPVIKEYLSEFDAYIEDFYLRGRRNNTPVWHISWRWMPTLGEDYHDARVEIDASTGEVLSASADTMDDPSKDDLTHYLFFLLFLYLFLRKIYRYEIKKKKDFMLSKVFRYYASCFLDIVGIWVAVQPYYLTPIDIKILTILLAKGILLLISGVISYILKRIYK